MCCDQGTEHAFQPRAKCLPERAEPRLIPGRQWPHAHLDSTPCVRGEVHAHQHGHGRMGEWMHIS